MRARLRGCDRVLKRHLPAFFPEPFPFGCADASYERGAKFHNAMCLRAHKGYAVVGAQCVGLRKQPHGRLGLLLCNDDREPFEDETEFEVVFRFYPDCEALAERRGAANDEKRSEI